MRKPRQDCSQKGWSADILQNKRVPVMTAMEEDITDHFYSGCMFVLADSVSKSDRAILR